MPIVRNADGSRVFRSNQTERSQVMKALNVCADTRDFAYNGQVKEIAEKAHSALAELYMEVQKPKKKPAVEPEPAK